MVVFVFHMFLNQLDFIFIDLFLQIKIDVLVTRQKPKLDFFIYVYYFSLYPNLKTSPGEYAA